MQMRSRVDGDQWDVQKARVAKNFMHFNSGIMVDCKEYPVRIYFFPNGDFMLLKAK